MDIVIEALTLMGQFFFGGLGLGLAFGCCHGWFWRQEQKKKDAP